MAITVTERMNIRVNFNFKRLTMNQTRFHPLWY